MVVILSDTLSEEGSEYNLVNNVEKNVVCLSSKVFNYDNSSIKFLSLRNAFAEKPQMKINSSKNQNMDIFLIRQRFQGYSRDSDMS